MSLGIVLGLGLEFKDSATVRVRVMIKDSVRVRFRV